MTPRRLLSHPVLVFLVILGALTAAAPTLGIPLDRVTEIAIYALYAIGVNLLLGYTGLMSFGASLFFGVGTYAAAIVALRVVPNEVAALGAAVLSSVLLGLVAGALVLRRRGLYFSLLTLALSQLAFEVAFKWTGMTGGENGLQSVPRVLFASPMAFHLFCLASVALLLLLLWRFVHAPPGRVLQAIRDNEQRAKCIGYDTYRYKLLAFTLSALLIGYGGGLLAFLVRGAYANNLGWQHAADAVLMAVLGGVHHFLGPLWGAMAFVVLRDQLSLVTEHWWLLFAPVIVAFILLSPGGLQGAWNRIGKGGRQSLTRVEPPRRPDRITPFHDGRVAPAFTGPILSVWGLSKSFGSIVTARDISLDVEAVGLHSFIGPNGAGKTTFFNMITGLVAPDAGEIRLKGELITRLRVHRRARLGLSRSFQIISLFRGLSAFECVRLAVQAHSPQRFGWWRDACDDAAVEARTWSILAAVRLADRAGDLCADLSHGEQRLLDLAIVLGSAGDLLLLDEPLAGLSEADRHVVSEVVLEVARSHAVLMIEHDIDRVMSLSGRITVLHQGRLIADGPPQAVARDPAVIAAYVGSGAALGEALARHTAPQSEGRPAPLLTLQGVRGGYEGSTVLQGIDLTLRQGEVVALLGRNGVGKTTLLKAITGALPGTAGRITLDGEEIAGLPTHAINRRGIGLVPEGRRIFPNLTVRENLLLAVRRGGGTLEEAYALFPKLRLLASSRAGTLSGGEQQMLAIARVLMFPTRVILLDEPFEGLAPAIVKEVMAAVASLRGRAGIILVEHNAELVLPLADRAYVLVNGRVAFEGEAEALRVDTALQARLLGVAAVPQEAVT
ncbi:ATP-binding cassette domain-containing protein [Roseomonas chloroacetimidivorans]|uniref:branched-chain amino acid ABC transporter ATP-binding protein/permease n=1 Tax=Roseomonas chloroacetimidivorans TaxID=1766656 RepID=UPI003C717E06